MCFDGYTFFLGTDFLKRNLGAQAMLCSAFIEIMYHSNVVSSPASISIRHDFCPCRSLNFLGKPTVFVVGLKIIPHKDDGHSNFCVFELLSFH